MPRDLYEPTPPPPAAAVSRRAFLGLGRVRTSIDYDGATTRLREQPSRPRRMARELVRVVRPGGIVAVTAWASKGLPGRLDELLERPQGLRAPSDWGRREVMTQRLGPVLEGLELRTRSVQLRFPDTGAFFDALGAPPALRPRLERVLASCNNAVEGVEVDARYLLATGRRAG